MGMAASQARLLSITARLTDNENSGQAVSYSKQRLADQTQQITNEYNEALSATKLTVLTGFNGAEANYTDISYNLMTGLQMAENTRQYIVTDAKGKILVTEDIAKAYEKSHGNYNQFLYNLTGSTVAVNGKAYSQADINVQANSTDEAAKEAAMTKIHEAWDKYFETVGIDFMVDDEHNNPDEFRISWTTTWSTDQNGNYLDKDGNVLDTQGLTGTALERFLQQNGASKVGDGFASYALTNDEGQYIDKKGNAIIPGEDGYTSDQVAKMVYLPINYEGTTQESRDLYDYAMALTEAYLRVGNQGNNENYVLENFNSASDSDNANALTYYKNIFSKMQSSGYFTYTNTPGLAAKDEHYIYAEVGTGTAGNVQKSPLKDNYTFEAALRNGTLRLEYYSAADKAFTSTTISEDNCIQEVADERAIAKAESKYTQDMADIENKDNKLDLELKKLDTEHNALQTEYESVKNVVDKNVESSFKIFS